ncbi:uncharacterized protein CCR75_006948 [Bremia lactucae]|uniref:Uncharacterized protein n=1 Tax=Bremia lactucae TaxID=4779 RepID=A0A976NYN0_BRELC|nr:hypothetical protein CCR75_006948 [Bremia lactucae]
MTSSFIAGKRDVRPDPEMIKAITDWPVPVNVKGLRMFLGYRRTTKIFTQLCRSDSASFFFVEEKCKVVMAADCQRSFESIEQQRLMQSPIVAIADRDKPFMWSVTPPILQSAV